MTYKCLACLVNNVKKCEHVAFRAACNDCEWEILKRYPAKETMCPKCYKWVEYTKLEVGKGGYW